MNRNNKLKKVVVCLLVVISYKEVNAVLSRSNSTSSISSVGSNTSFKSAKSDFSSNSTTSNDSFKSAKSTRPDPYEGLDFGTGSSIEDYPESPSSLASTDSGLSKTSKTSNVSKLSVKLKSAAKQIKSAAKAAGQDLRALTAPNEFVAEEKADNARDLASVKVTAAQKALVTAKTKPTQENITAVSKALQESSTALLAHAKATITLQKSLGSSVTKEYAQDMLAAHQEAGKALLKTHQTVSKASDALKIK